MAVRLNRKIPKIKLACFLGIFLIKTGIETETVSMQ